jgi:hypothetical protein
VVLLNTLGRFIEPIMARRLSYMVETYGLLPPTDLDGHRSGSTDHTIQFLLDRINRSWGVGLSVASVALHDVTGAYGNTAHVRLLHDLRRKGLGKLIPWVMALLSDQPTRIRMHKGLAERAPTLTGIPQEKPLLPVLYKAGLI